MKTLVALAWREISDRRLLLLASAFLGLVPIVAPWLPGQAQRHAPEEVRFAVAFALVVLFGGVALLMLASTIVGRDLSEGRLGFYFSRPVSAWTLWLSRLVAACALLLASVVLISAPTAAIDFEWSEVFSSESGRAWPLLGLREVFSSGFAEPALPPMPPTAVRMLIVCGLLLLLLTTVHLVSSIVRARSLWLLADLAALAMVASLGWTARDALVREQALGALVWAEWVLLPWLLGATLVAGGAQLAFGRTDLKRGHHALSLTLWPALLLAALGLGAFGRWVASSDVEDLGDLAHVETSANEDWLVLGGPTRHRAGAAAAFLLDARSGRSWRLGSLGVVRAWSDSSDDGGTLAWGRCESFSPSRCELWVKDLRQPTSPPRPTGVPLGIFTDRVVLSADGTRVAIAEQKRLVVYELDSSRLLAAVGAKYPEAVAFASENLVRFHVQVETVDGWTTRIRQLDLDARRAVETGRLPRGRLVRRDPRRDVMIHSSFPSGFGLYHGGSGEPLAEFRDQRLPSSAHFLTDGRAVLTIVPYLRTGTLLVLSPEGEELHHIERPEVKGVRLGGELSPGRLLVALRETETPAQPVDWRWRRRADSLLRGWNTYVLDAGTGELTPLADGVVPLGAPAEILSERLFFAGGRSVAGWNLETGERRVIWQPSERLEGDGSPLPF